MVVPALLVIVENSIKFGLYQIMTLFTWYCTWLMRKHLDRDYVEASSETSYVLSLAHFWVVERPHIGTGLLLCPQGALNKFQVSGDPGAHVTKQWLN